MPYLTDAPIATHELIEQVRRPSDGAVAFFAGVVRDNNEGRQVESVFYEAYRPMAEKEIDRVVSEVRERHSDVRIALKHRLGPLRVGECSIAIACASPHRAAAFEACRELIDQIKQSVPIWKKEKSPQGEEWVGWQK